MQRQCGQGRGWAAPIPGWRRTAPEYRRGSLVRQGVEPRFRARNLRGTEHARTGSCGGARPRRPISCRAAPPSGAPPLEEVHRQGAQLVDRRARGGGQVPLDRRRRRRRPIRLDPEVLARSAGRGACGSGRTRTRPTSAPLASSPRPPSAASRACCGPRSRRRSRRPGRRGRSRTPRATAASVVRSPGSLPPVTTNDWARPSCHSFDRVIEACLEHRRRSAVVLRRPEHHDGVRPAAARRGRPAARSGPWRTRRRRRRPGR